MQELRSQYDGIHKQECPVGTHRERPSGSLGRQISGAPRRLTRMNADPAILEWSPPICAPELPIMKFIKFRPPLSSATTFKV